MLMPYAAWGATPEEARKELEKMNIEYSVGGFFQAVKAGDKMVVDLFLEAGMNIDSKDDSGSTALMAAVTDQEGDGTAPASVSTIDMVKLLLEKGADVNARGSRGGDPSLAKKNNRTAAAELLLAAGAGEQKSEEEQQRSGRPAQPPTAFCERGPNALEYHSLEFSSLYPKWNRFQKGDPP
jgi:ankyrin repeat protein